MAADVILTAEAEAISRVSVNAPFQVVHEGIIYKPNEVAEVPEHVAAQWVLSGWVVDNGPKG
jgi:hypothetical protein